MLNNVQKAKDIVKGRKEYARYEKSLIREKAIKILRRMAEKIKETAKVELDQITSLAKDATASRAYLYPFKVCQV